MADGGIEWLHDGVPVARRSTKGHELTINALLPGYDRLRVRFHAEPGECVWGGGEQMSYLALNGRAFPIWTSEPGVGRDKSTELTRIMDAEGMAGGDYWNTNYPQPTFLTSRWIAVHLDASCYSVLDFTDPGFHAVDVWSDTANFELFAADGPLELVSALSKRFGRQPKLPDWAIGAASGSWPMPFPLLPWMATCSPKRQAAAIFVCVPTATRSTWSISASSTVAWSISLAPKRAPGSQSAYWAAKCWISASTAGWRILANICPPTCASRTAPTRWRRTIAGRCSGPRSTRARSKAAAEPAMRRSSCVPAFPGCRRIAPCSGRATSRSISPGTMASAR